MWHNFIKEIIIIVICSTTPGTFNTTNSSYCSHNLDAVASVMLFDVFILLPVLEEETEKAQKSCTRR